MAKVNIKEMKRIDKNRNMVHEEVEATYSVFTKDRKKYFQIDTYGTKGRKIPSKASQVIQLDRDDVLELISLLKKDFLL